MAETGAARASQEDQTGPDTFGSKSAAFSKSYLEADDAGKPQYYRAVEDISRGCQPPLAVTEPASNDSRIADATSEAALKMLFQLQEGLAKKDQPDFLTDACATVAIAYHRAAGVYARDEKMKELGTAAVHLLTMATSYMAARMDRISNQSTLPFGEEA